MTDRENLRIGGTAIAPGKRATIDLPVASLSSHTPMTMPVQVVRGRRPGPTIFVCGAVHGDEINGAEVVRRLLHHRSLGRLRGTLIAIPIVNVFGFITHSRYLPDRRDLNRSFPGSARGSLAGRLADLFMTEIVAHCSHGIDLHTGARHRTNLPQLRANLDDPEVLELCGHFGVPVMLHAASRPGSLREAADAAGVKLIVYEGGEALRFDEISIRAALRGTISVLRALEMLPPARGRQRQIETIRAFSTGWVRAPGSGILRDDCRLGSRVKKGAHLGVVADPFGEQEYEVVARESGIIIGRTNLPLVQEGDALYHVASAERPDAAVASLEAFENEYDEFGQNRLYD